MHFFRNIYTLILVLLLSACAQIVAPGGGLKDATPPKVKKYIPDSASTNIKPKSIFIVFDEYINLKDLHNQLIISPPLSKAPDINVKDKTLLINFSKDDTLKSNTTYVFSFGNSIQDNNENNPKEDFKYVFSTGNFIDSLTIKGKVENAFDHKTEKGILVMLYRNYDDSTIYKHTPDYFTKTKEDGTFKITNVRDGKYKVIALKDANANYKYDSEDEKIAFIDTLVNVPSSENLLLELFQEPPKKFKLTKYLYNSYGRVDFYFNKGSDSITIKPINYIFNDGDIICDYSANRDSLTYWFRNIDTDSLHLQLSNGSKIVDTIKLKLITKEEALGHKRNPLKFKVMSSPDKNMSFDLGAPLNIVFSSPIKIYTNGNINLKEDSSLIAKQKSFVYFLSDSGQIATVGKWDSTNVEEDPFYPGVMIKMPKKVFFNKWKPNTNYHLFIPPSTFTDFFGLTNDTINIDFKTREETYYGSLKMQINIARTEQNYIIQLLDEKENVIRRNNIQTSETIIYEHLSPAKYKLKIIYDINKNYKWDSGNIFLKKQPEKIIYNSELINIRANWDLDLKWEMK